MTAAKVRLEDLVERAQWVAWRNEKRIGKDAQPVIDKDGRPRITKVPYTAPGVKAEADNPATWLPHDQAAAVADAIVNGAGGGVGIELGPCGDYRIFGIDLDTCRDPATGVIAKWAQDVINRFPTYAEISPSGTGVKLYA
jgi:primase-polymerase (primpol)-like protein